MCFCWIHSACVTLSRGCCHAWHRRFLQSKGCWKVLVSWTVKFYQCFSILYLQIKSPSISLALFDTFQAHAFEVHVEASFLSIITFNNLYLLNNSHIWKAISIDCLNFSKSLLTNAFSAPIKHFCCYFIDCVS